MWFLLMIGALCTANTALMFRIWNTVLAVLPVFVAPNVLTVKRRCLTNAFRNY